MNEEHASAGKGSVDEHAALFANLVLQQSNMAMMLMGEVPHPETGKPFKDLQAAQLFIEQLEMLEAKTKGNLSNEEIAFLRHSLMTLRMSFVKAVEAGDKPAEQPAPAAPGQAAAPTPPPAAPADDESRTKFSKKY
jgi:hypothetical protein